MSREVSGFWKKIHRAQKNLEDQFLNDLDLSLIDIDYSPKHYTKTDEIMLRIHVRKHWMEAMPEERDAFPDQLDGIPVIVIPGDYQLDTNSSGADEE